VQQKQQRARRVSAVDERTGICDVAAMEQWEVAKCGGVCAATGRQLAEGEEHWAVLFEAGESFRREDYALDAWNGPPPGAFCSFRTRVPIKEKKKRLLVDDDVLINFFTRLAGEPEETRVHFRFVLALILMRKRLLRYEETDRTAAQEIWMMRLARDREGPLHSVVNPRLNDAQIERVSRELGAILHGDMLADDLQFADAQTDQRDEFAGDPPAFENADPQPVATSPEAED
jgi:hypothetical protein